MNINIKLKIRSLMRRNQKFHCLSYNWETRQIIVHQRQQQYIDQLAHLKNSGMVKRAQCYLDEPFLCDRNEAYFLYMVSFGDFRKGKMVNGENPLAKGLGVCMFDFVFIFIDGFNEAQKRMELRMREMQKRGEVFHRDLMMQTYCKFFQDRSETTQSIRNFSVLPAPKLEKEQSFEI